MESPATSTPLSVFTTFSILQFTVNRSSPNNQRTRQPMAAIVPISCTRSWRSRSRNASTDSDFLGLVPASPSVVGGLSINLLHETNYDGDDEDKGVERVESPHNLVMPREFTAQEPAWPVVRPSNAKAMERRRASGF